MSDCQRFYFFVVANCSCFLHTVHLSLTKEDVVMGMLKKFEMAKEDETAQEKWKLARKQKRQVPFIMLLLDILQLLNNATPAIY